MTAEDFIKRLESRGLKPKQSGSKQWNAQCPAHDDKSPSLRISEGSKGQVLTHCNAGCSFAEIVRALGARREEMFQENKPTYKRSDPTRYEIRDSSGQLVAELCRLDIAHKQKKFGWERNGKKGLGGLKLEDLPLYRSEDLSTIFDKKRPVFVTEGPKDCDALRALRLQALGSVTGAASCPSRQMLVPLKGFCVVLWPDHDAVGYTHMRKLAERLKGIASKISFILPPSPNPTDGADDWEKRATKEGTTREEMRETLEGVELHSVELPLWEGEAMPPNNPSEQPSLLPSPVNKKGNQGPDLEHLAPLGIVTYTLASIDQAREKELLSLAELPIAEDGSKSPRYGWGTRFNDIIGGGLAPGVLVALGASSAGAGKTSFLMQLIDGLALRSALLVETKEEGPLTPVFLLSEMSPEDLNQRRLAWLTQERATTWRAGKTSEKKNTKAYVDGLYSHARRLRSETGTLTRVLSWSRQVVRGEALALGSDLVPTVRALVASWRAQLEEKYEREVWPVVVFDPIQRFLRKDKDEVSAQNELVSQIDAAADEDGWLCFVTSDTNKSGAKGEASGDAGEIGAAVLRGSYSLIHGADIGCYLSKSEAPSKEAPIHTIALQFFKNRSGPSFEDVLYYWEKATGRFREFSHNELEARQGAQLKEKIEQKKTKNNKEEVYK